MLSKFDSAFKAEMKALDNRGVATVVQSVAMFGAVMTFASLIGF